jgi:hypothetical protein
MIHTMQWLTEVLNSSIKEGSKSTYDRMHHTTIFHIIILKKD